MTTARYHHGNLRAALVEAGVAAVRESGPDGVALRDLARRVGVSHNAAYRHFADRDELMGEIAGAGMAALGEEGRERLAGVGETDPVLRARLRLRELGRGYVAFARRERGLFRVAFADHPSLEGTQAMDVEAEAASGESPFGQLVACLDEMEAAGFLASSARPGAEYTCWAAVHGLAMLLLEGPLQRLPDDAAASIVEEVLSSLDRGLGATTGPHPPLG
ncbi:TetR/AcrR family transcriptional regulator [Nocardioides okcheonensis]|uniref:TetR/AcrR family transcriptional regulator n=1 Tax=Nocardioides okcheonensis TaxID=2894081 RepID=UPI001E3BE08B|nr:TetR/AcrR family transcriptional regulator [Nocardioides okcheonensis]UFN45066.1 TetR/AcrR family transcriptional regulator [Nocardioides okcheonensis]